MAATDVKQRSDSVTEAHDPRKTTYIQTRVARKASYSLYPSCSSVPTSPVPRDRRSIDQILSPDVGRPKPVSHDTALKSPVQSPATASETTEEPLFEDFHFRLSDPETPSHHVHSPLASNSDLSSSPATTSPDVTKPRTPRSVEHLPPLFRENHRIKSYSNILNVATSPSASSSPERERDSAREFCSQDENVESVMDEPRFSPELKLNETTPSLAPLQSCGLQDAPDQIYTFYADDPKNFDLLVPPPQGFTRRYQLEARSSQMFSAAHLRQIFADPRLLLLFSNFLQAHRPKSVPLLAYYLDATKAINAIRYANTITESLERLQGHDFSDSPPPSSVNRALERCAAEAFDALVRDELPAYITHTWVHVVHESIVRRVTGTLAPHLREASEGLAEVFCLSDPSRPDNPVVFASEEFQRTTQYGMSYCVGRNCRFLQGPHTDQHSVRRLAEAVRAGREHSEVFLNYRRDGSPFMNLLMIAPLHDSQGKIRYFIGAQIDVSNLAKGATDLEGLARLTAHERSSDSTAEADKMGKKERVDSLGGMLHAHELAADRCHDIRMHRGQIDDDRDRASIISTRPRPPLTHSSSDIMDAKSTTQHGREKEQTQLSGRLQGPYQHYFLLRPYPSLRILFTSPSLRIPGMLQSPFLSRIGGSSRVKAGLSQAFADGRGVTAKIRWLTKLDQDGEGDGRSRWVHATPLLNHRGEIGVWMVVLVDAEAVNGEGRRCFHNPPAVSDPRRAGPAMHTTGTRRERNNDRVTIGGTPAAWGQRYDTKSLDDMYHVGA